MVRRLTRPLKLNGDMQVIVDHNRIIAQVAKSVLAPAGCRQKGRSRIWYDDHSWWIGVVEFQPSAWSRGSFLNVGTMWLWNAKDYWSFDEGYRIESFVEFKEPSLFEESAKKLAERALDEVNILRQKFRTITDVAQSLSQKDRKGVWEHFHCAVSAAIAGNAELAMSEFEAVGAIDASAPWMVKLQAKASELSSLCSSKEALQRVVQAEVARARDCLKLPSLLPDEKLWA